MVGKCVPAQCAVQYGVTKRTVALLSRATGMPSHRQRGRACTPRPYENDTPFTSGRDWLPQSLRPEPRLPHSLQ
jgi:hypothetical protein